MTGRIIQALGISTAEQRLDSLPAGRQGLTSPSSGGDEISSGWRRIPALGNANLSWTLEGLASGTCRWSGQAIDTAFCASPWAPEHTVTVPQAVRYSE